MYIFLIFNLYDRILYLVIREFNSPKEYLNTNKIGEVDCVHILKIQSLTANMLKLLTLVKTNLITTLSNIVAHHEKYKSIKRFFPPLSNKLITPKSHYAR